MAEMITTGIWIVEEAKQAAFLEEWTAFAEWASSMDGAGTLRISRDGADPRRFVSFGAWDSPELVHAWKAGLSSGRAWAWSSSTSRSSTRASSTWRQGPPPGAG